MYLLDTNVVSELRRRRPHPGVVEWVESIPARDIFVSAVSVGEIQAGIQRTREQDPAKADELEAWLAQLAASHEILPMDADSFREWGRIRHRRSDTLLVDAMIAATARVHGLTVATRDLADFRTLDVDVFDPFTGASVFGPVSLTECAREGLNKTFPSAAVSVRSSRYGDW